MMGIFHIPCNMKHSNLQFSICNFQFAIWLTLILGMAPFALAVEPMYGMLELSYQGRKIEGSPIKWDENQIHLLGRDGGLWSINPADVKDYKKTADHFRAYSPSEVRALLLVELGNEYEVSGTSHYLVAHARGQSEIWAERFEQLYRSFTSYFSVRGFRPSAPPFPLIGVVCRNQHEFQRYSTENGVASPNGVLGFYSWQSNRIMLYDMGARANSKHWQQNASVVIHEATHQTAFNTGLHSRYCQPPVWLAEGLAMLFEAPGVYNAHDYPNLSDRINRGRWQNFRSMLENRHRPELLASMIASDQIFSINPPAAYAEAWAFTFFLMENEPHKYAQFLSLTASRTPFSEYTAAQRSNDFIATFGADWQMLEARFLRFMQGLK